MTPLECSVHFFGVDKASPQMTTVRIWVDSNGCAWVAPLGSPDPLPGPAPGPPWSPMGVKVPLSPLGGWMVTGGRSQPRPAASEVSDAELAAIEQGTRCPRCGATRPMSRWDVCGPCAVEEGWEPSADSQ